MAKFETALPATIALIFTTEGDAKLWHGRSIKKKKTRENVCLTGVTTGMFQPAFQSERTIPYKNRIDETHIYKRQKYLDMTKDQRDAGFKAVVMLVEVAAREFMTKLSICSNKRTKALKLK